MVGGTKVIGVLGGMGPAATADFFQKLIEATPAKTDQDHLKVVIFSNPHVPDRTAAIRGDGPDPLPELVAGAEALVRAGADFLTIPCVTVHYFFDRLQAATRIPILHLIREAATAVAAEFPTLRRFGLLATTGTVESKLFEAKFEPRGLSVFGCEPAIQDSMVMDAIYAVKRGDSLDRPRRLIRQASAHLIGRGAEAIIAGCTEIPLVLSQGDISVPVIDPTRYLAQAAVRRALASDPPTTTRRTCYKDRG
jgi:aspartate racemase